MEATERADVGQGSAHDVSCRDGSDPVIVLQPRCVGDVGRGQVFVHTNTQRGHVGGPASRHVAVALVGEAVNTHRLTKICCRQMGF